MKITYSETQIKSLEKNIESNENELNYFRKYKEKIERFDDVIQENNQLKTTLDMMKKKSDTEIFLELKNSKSKIKELLSSQ